MAAALTRHRSIPVWNPAEVTSAACTGFFAVRVWEQVINYNNSDSEHPVLWRSVVGVCGGLFLTHIRASYVLSPLAEMGNPGALFFQNYEGAFVAATVALVILNGITIFADQTNKKPYDFTSQLDKFRLAVWKMTPYLMLVTNIALLIIDIPQSKGLGLISLATAGITLIDLTSWKPKDFDWYLDVVVKVPLGIAMMYYDEDARIPIFIVLATDIRIRKTFENCISRLN